MTGLDINRFLPHRDRMQLIDAILEIDATKAVTRSTVTNRWPLFDGGSVSSLVIIELAAQTAGVRNTWEGIQKHGPGFQTKGWLVGIKHSAFFLDTIPLGTPVFTTCRNQFELEGYREVLGLASLSRDDTGKADIIGEVTLQLLQSD